MKMLRGGMVVSLVLGCASSAPQPPATAEDERAVQPKVLEDTLEPPGDEAATGTDAELAAALERASREGWKRLDLVVECQHEGRLEIMQLWGSGVGVWQDSRQFRLPREEVAAILDELRQGGFAAMSPIYGGPPDSIEVSGEEGQGARVICRLVLNLDGLTKQVAQRKRGEQSMELKRLAGGILDRCRERGLSGLAADSLADGLAMLATGKLAPETLRIVAQRKPEGATAGEDQIGWLLRLHGPEASARTHRRAVGYGDPVVGRLDAEELRSIIALLTDAGVDSLPINLWAEQYTDLLVVVLDHRKRVQARRFAGMGPTTHGEAQQRFDRVFAGLEELGAKLLAPAADPAG